MSIGLNLSLPCIAAIWALSCFARILRKSSALTVIVIFGVPAAPVLTQSEGLVRSIVQVPPSLPVMLKWITALMSLASSGLFLSTLGISVSRMSLAVMCRAAFRARDPNGGVGLRQGCASA